MAAPPWHASGATKEKAALLVGRSQDRWPRLSSRALEPSLSGHLTPDVHGHPAELSPKSTSQQQQQQPVAHLLLHALLLLLLVPRPLLWRRRPRPPPLPLPREVPGRDTRSTPYTHSRLPTLPAIQRWPIVSSLSHSPLDGVDGVAGPQPLAHHLHGPPPDLGRQVAVHLPNTTQASILRPAPGQLPACERRRDGQAGCSFYPYIINHPVEQLTHPEEQAEWELSHTPRLLTEVMPERRPGRKDDGLPNLAGLLVLCTSSSLRRQASGLKRRRCCWFCGRGVDRFG